MRNNEILAYRERLTVSELKHIISETPMRETARKIAELRYCHEKTYEEIAEIVDCDWKTVQRRMTGIIAPKIQEMLFRFNQAHT